MWLPSGGGLQAGGALKDHLIYIQRLSQFHLIRKGCNSPQGQLGKLMHEALGRQAGWAKSPKSQ